MDDSSALSERWTEYERLREGGAAYSAIVRISEIANYLAHHKGGSRDLIEHWTTRLRGLEVPKDTLMMAIDQSYVALDRLRRMLSFGTDFQYEELVAALTSRVELELFAGFLRRLGTNIDLDFQLIDEELLSVAKTRGNTAAFREAQAAIRRNWGLPIRAAWLEP